MKFLLMFSRDLELCCQYSYEKINIFNINYTEAISLLSTYLAWKIINYSFKIQFSKTVSLMC